MIQRSVASKSFDKETVYDIRDSGLAKHLHDSTTDYFHLVIVADNDLPEEDNENSQKSKKKSKKNERTESLSEALLGEIGADSGLSRSDQDS